MNLYRIIVRAENRYCIVFVLTDINRFRKKKKKKSISLVWTNVFLQRYSKRADRYYYYFFFYFKFPNLDKGFYSAIKCYVPIFFPPSQIATLRLYALYLFFFFFKHIGKPIYHRRVKRC